MGSRTTFIFTSHRRRHRNKPTTRSLLELLIKRLKNKNDICLEALSILKDLGRGILKDGVVVVDDDATALEILEDKLTIFKDTHCKKLINLRILSDNKI